MRARNPNSQAEERNCSSGRTLAAALLAAVSTGALLQQADAQTPAAAAATSPISFDISAQPLASALSEFARQSGVHILYPYDQIRPISAPSVRGQFSREEALAQLLADSDYVAVIDEAGTVRLENRDRPQRVSAQTQGADETGPTGSPATARVAEATQEEASSQEEIVVTGTRIRGAGPVGSHVVTVDRLAIEESGLSTTEQLIRTLPQAFGGGFAQHISFQGGNIGGGSGINLRGLGADATLTLLNGRRLPVMGLSGHFADISGIPVTAIERVEVLPDSASAIYGSDAVGGVVNFIMRRDFEGFELGVRSGAVTDGDLGETRINATTGGSFGMLQLFAAYEHLDRSALRMADRRYLADSDLTSLGGDNFDLTRSNPANLIVSGLGTFAVPGGQDGVNLNEADLIAGQVNRANANEGLDALPDQTQDALYASARLEFSPSFEIFGDARVVERSFLSANAHVTQRLTIPATNAFRAVNNLFAGRTLQADYDFFRDLGPRLEEGDIRTIDLALGAALDFGATWRFEPILAYGRVGGDHVRRNLINTPALNAALASSDPAIAFNPFGDGSFTSPATLDSIRGYSRNELVSEVWSIAGKADGELFELPAGPLRLALGGDYRQEFFEIGGEGFTTTPAPVERISSSNGRNVTAAFAEILIPVFGPGLESPLGRKLDVSLAGRFERYSDFGETTNPKAGFAWELVDGLSLRGSYGHSFRAPNLADLDPTGDLNRRQVRGLNITDPVSPTGRSNIIILLGANPELTEQTAESWSAGLSYRPPEGALSFDLNYFDVRFADRIASISNVAASLNPNSEFAALVDRTPDPALVAQLLAEAAALGTSGGFAPADISAIVDARAHNLAVTSVNGVDLSASLWFDLGGGELELRADATYILEFLRAATPDAAPRDIVGTLGNPADLKARLGASWRSERFGAAAFVNYTGGYRDNLSSPQRDIDAWTTVDLRLSADLPPVGFAREPQIALSVTNLFDQDPPFVNNSSGVGYDPANADPLGRFVAIELSSRF